LLRYKTTNIDLYGPGGGMSGIFFLLILFVWFSISIKIPLLFVCGMQSGNKKVITYRILCVLCFIAPVADEIVGGFQFRALCTPENMLVYDVEKVKGRTIQYAPLGRRTINKIIPIRVNTTELVDPYTGETLIIHKTYYAKGGWLSRFIGFPQGSPPYTFNGTCRSKEYYELFEKLNIKKIEGYYGE